MRHIMRSAPPPLDRYIEMLWYWEGDPTTHLKDTIMASAGMGLLINLAEDRLNWYSGEGYADPHRLRGIGIAGPSSGTFAIDAFQRKMMGVQFRAGGASTFFGAAIHAFADGHISLEDIWGMDAERLHQRLVQAPTPTDKFDILLRVLVEMAPEGFVRHPAVDHALRRFAHTSDRVSIAAVAEETGLSRKKFIQVFSEHVGFRPKLYLRIVRFQRALKQIAGAPHIDWGDIVAWNGYYDQSHFIRDFGQFSSVAPNTYLKRRGPYLQHVPIPV